MGQSAFGKRSGGKRSSSYEAENTVTNSPAAEHKGSTPLIPKPSQLYQPPIHTTYFHLPKIYKKSVKAPKTPQFVGYTLFVAPSIFKTSLREGISISGARVRSGDQDVWLVSATPKCSRHQPHYASHAHLSVD